MVICLALSRVGLTNMASQSRALWKLLEAKPTNVNGNAIGYIHLIIRKRDVDVAHIWIDYAPNLFFLGKLVHYGRHLGFVIFHGGAFYRFLFLRSQRPFLDNFQVELFLNMVPKQILRSPSTPS
jgi:hypothetical protein